MKFGVFLPSHGPAKSPQAVKQVAQSAEQAGFDSLWAADHVLVHERFSDFCMIETFVTLGYVAAVTETITLGTTVLVCRSAIRFWRPSRRPRSISTPMAA